MILRTHELACLLCKSYQSFTKYGQKLKGPFAPFFGCENCMVEYLAFKKCPVNVRKLPRNCKGTRFRVWNVKEIQARLTVWMLKKITRRSIRCQFAHIEPSIYQIGQQENHLPNLPQGWHACFLDTNPISFCKIRSPGIAAISAWLRHARPEGQNNSAQALKTLCACPELPWNWAKNKLLWLEKLALYQTHHFWSSLVQNNLESCQAFWVFCPSISFPHQSTHKPLNCFGPGTVKVSMLHCSQQALRHPSIRSKHGRRHRPWRSTWSHENMWKKTILLLMAEIWRSPVEVGSLSHDLKGFTYPR